MVTELKKKGMTMQLLWERYLNENPGGYQYSQFCLHFEHWRDASEVTMHIEYKAGEAMLVDWAGDKLEVINGNTGKPWALELFVAILGASQLTYVEVRESQQEADWIRANEGALRYFGGSTEALIPDNTKTAVARSDPYEPGLNPVFEEFALHYGLVVMPTRVRRPRDKALVENAVRLVYQRISCRLQGQVFFSLAELNAAVRELLEQHNGKAFDRLPYSRRELFELVERAALRPLPSEPFMMKSTTMGTVGVNYHVELREDRHYYSVPHPLRRRDPPTRVKIVLGRSGGVPLLGQRTRGAAPPRSHPQRLYDAGGAHAEPPSLVCGVEPRALPLVGCLHGIGNQRAHRQGLVLGSLSPASVPQLFGDSESCPSPRVGSAERGVRQGPADRNSLLHPYQEHPRPQGGTRSIPTARPGAAAPAREPARRRVLQLTGRTATMNNNQATIEKLERMGMWGMMRTFRQSMDSSRAAEETPDELFARLVDAEWDERQGRRLARLLKNARMRYRAGMEDVDFHLKRNLEKNQLLRLADCAWVEQHQDLILTGPCGCGKSFLASMFGQQACLRGLTVSYWSAAKLFEHMKLCKADGSYLRELSRLARKRLWILDDFGLEVLDTASRLILLEILEDRHGRASSLFTSQLPVAQWHTIIGDPTIADAICDRIVHTAHRIELKGESVRKLYAQREAVKPGEGQPSKKSSPTR